MNSGGPRVSSSWFVSLSSERAVLGHLIHDVSSFKDLVTDLQSSSLTKKEQSLSNVIKFPKSNLSSDAKFEEETKNLPPQLVDCMKSAYEQVNKQYGKDLPSFELHVSGDITDTQTEQIRVAVEELMASYKERNLAMLRSILELKTEICMIKFKENLL